MDDKRSVPRMRTLLSGKIILEGGVIDCLLRNRSETGVRLKVETVIGIPERFTLLIERGGERRLVRVVWRKQNEIGAAFEDGPQT